MKKVMLGFLIAIFVIGIVGCYQVDHPTSVFEDEEHFANLYEEVSQSVVAIETYVVNQPYSLGSGMIFKREVIANNDFLYYVVTNYHVVQGATHVKVFYSRNDSILADIYATPDIDLYNNPEQDVAIIRFRSSLNFRVQPIIPFEDSSRTVTYRVGHSVFSIGTPLDLFLFNLMSNIGTIASIDQNWIIHSANINPGNSGGPLFSSDGTFVGMNTSRIEMTLDGERPVTLIGLAISVNQVARVINQLMRNVSPRLGLKIMNTHTWGSELGFLDMGDYFLGVPVRTVLSEEIVGVIVIGVSTTLNSDGFELFDVIQVVNGVSVRNIAELTYQVGTIRLGQSFEFGVNRRLNEVFFQLEVNRI